MKEYSSSADLKRNIVSTFIATAVAVLVSVPLALNFAQTNQHADALSNPSGQSSTTTASSNGGCTGTGTSQATTAEANEGMAGVLGASTTSGGSGGGGSTVTRTVTITNTNSGTGNTGNTGFVNVPVNVSGNDLLSNDLNGNTVLSNDTVNALNNSVNDNTVTATLTVLKDTTAVVTDNGVNVLSNNLLN